MSLVHCTETLNCVESLPKYPSARRLLLLLLLLHSRLADITRYRSGL